LCKIKFYNLILPKPLFKWLVEALFSVSTNYNHYDHIVRSEQDYREIWEYIENNPLNLEDDHFNSEVKK